MKNNFIIENNIDYSSEELKQRKKLIKFIRGTHERFKKGTNFEKNAKDYILTLVDCFFNVEYIKIVERFYR